MCVTGLSGVALVNQLGQLAEDEAAFIARCRRFEKLLHYAEARYDRATYREAQRYWSSIMDRLCEALGCNRQVLGRYDHLEHEFRAGEIVGYRGWFITGDGKLESLVRDTVWEPGEVMCGPDRLSPGRVEGVYAFKDAFDLGLESYGIPSRAFVYGRVRMWGEIIEHEKGYRAQYAQVAALDRVLGCIANKTGVLNDLRRRYGVENPPEAA